MARLSVARDALAALRQSWNGRRGDWRSPETRLKVGALSGYKRIRTFLSLSLQLEIEGKLPWQRDVARQPQA
jgi:hypothetical protein